MSGGTVGYLYYYFWGNVWGGERDENNLPSLLIPYTLSLCVCLPHTYNTSYTYTQNVHRIKTCFGGLIGLIIGGFVHDVSCWCTYMYLQAKGLCCLRYPFVFATYEMDCGELKVKLCLVEFDHHVELRIVSVTVTILVKSLYWYIILFFFLLRRGREAGLE